MSAATVHALPTGWELRALLDALDREPDEKMSICYLDSGSFRSTLTTVALAEDAARDHLNGDLWFGTQALHPRVERGRGTAKDVVGLRDLTCDLDVKPDGMPSWQAAQDVIDDLSDVLGVLPVATVNTGHGLQPHWAIERDVDTDWPDEHDPRWSDAVALWRRWGRLVASVAARRGGTVDSVFDLSRVMRAPGSVNRKDAANPVPVKTEILGGSPVSLTRLREVCDDSGVIEHPEDREVLGDVVQPAATWSYGDQTCKYVVGMVTGWAGDMPDGRHPWLVSQGVRLAAARRLGCITEVDHGQAVEALAAHFRFLLTTGVVRSETLGEVSDALHWGVRRVEAMTDERARQALGSTEKPHRHAGSAIDVSSSGTQAFPAAAGATGRTRPEVASWTPLDLSQYLDGTFVPTQPTLLCRTDGQALLYRGLTHSVHGESESGKSLIMQIEAARLIKQGQRVLFIDFESDGAAVAQRLLTFGAAPSDITTSFAYVRPQANPQLDPNERAAWSALLSGTYELAVIDGVTDALSVFGAKTKENDDITDFMRSFPRQVAERTGAAVVMIDHVTKDSESRGRFAIGGQAKMAALTGAAFTVDVAHPLGIGLRGELILRVAKDRPGEVRGYCGPMRRDRTQEAARVVVDSTGTTTVVTVEPWRDGGTRAGKRAPRLTAVMERVSRTIEETPNLSKNKIAQSIGSGKALVLQAVDILVAEGFVTWVPGPNSSQLHTSFKPYRTASEPATPEVDGSRTT
jgi:hypothetical protein